MGKKTAVILAAGRGSRMGNLTLDCPKCLLPLAGKPMLQWQLDALHNAGINRIILVAGYKEEKLQGEFKKILNPRWAETNMVHTLLLSFPHLTDDETLLVSYADIVYRQEHVERLQNMEGDICLTYDADWETLWRLRQTDPLIDSETFRERNGHLLEIGKKPHVLSDIQGQYMGLLKFSSRGRQLVENYTQGLSAETLDHLDMTSLLQGLLDCATDIRVLKVHGGWCECDTARDRELYEERIQEGNFSHDWRS